MAEKITYENKATGIDDLSLLPKKVVTEKPEPRKQLKSDSNIVEIEVIKAHDGLEVGYTKKVRGNSATTIYMIDNGYWQVK